MKILATLAVVALMATAAQSADIVRTGNAVTISGQITDGDDTKFEVVTRGQKNISVLLDSKGGHNEPAARIGIRIHQYTWETRLHSGSICNSACTLIFLAAPYRYMDPDTRLGFHSASNLTDNGRNEKANGQIAAYLTWAGSPPQLIALQPKADPDSVNYVTYEMAVQWGILKRRSP